MKDEKLGKGLTPEHRGKGNKDWVQESWSHQKVIIETMAMHDTWGKKYAEKEQMLGQAWEDNGEDLYGYQEAQSSYRGKENHQGIISRNRCTISSVIF